MKALASIGVLAGALLALAPRAQADTYTAVAGAFDSSGSPCIETNGGGTASSPTGARFDCADASSAGFAQASAQTGVLGATAESHNSSGLSNPSRGTATAQYSGVVTFSSTIPGSTASSVAATPIMAASGSLAAANSAGAGATFIEFLDDNVALEWNVGVDSTGATCSSIVLSVPVPCSASVATAMAGVPISVPLGVPVPFEISLSVIALSPFGFGDSARADLGDTFEFPLSGPVWLLPDGFTANSAASFIVDDRFVPPGSTGSVPEPEEALDLLAAFGGLVLAWRRRR